MVNGEDLDKLKELGFAANIDSFESYVMYLKKSKDSGESVDAKTVSGAMQLLKRLKPDSKVFNYNFESSDKREQDKYDEMLESYGLESLFEVTDQTMINSIRDVISSEVMDDGIELIANLAIKGMRHRAIYYRGCLVRVERYGSNGIGEDITDIASVKLPELVAEWSTIPIVELRGYIAVEKNVYKILSDTCNNCLTSINYLMRDSATEEEMELIDYIYDSVYMSSEHEYAVPGINCIENELEHLKSLGFSVVDYKTFKDVTEDTLDGTIESIVSSMEDEYSDESKESSYECDGIRVRLNTNEMRYRLEQDYDNIDIILRMGKYWDKNVYSGTINNIHWDFGGEYCTPIADIEPVITVTGDVISEVSLENLGKIEELELCVGKEITFKFDKEAGNGKLVVQK